MGDRDFSSPPDSQPTRNLAEDLLYDHLSIHNSSSSASPTDLSTALQQSEAALIAKLAPAQLRTVASWMRAIANTYDHSAASQVSHSFRAQASRLDQLARQAVSSPSTIVATLMSATEAYLMTETGEYLRQPIGPPGEADCPAELCSPAEFRQAYDSSAFTVLLGAERLTRSYGVGGEGSI